MSRPRLNAVGMRFGRLVVTGEAGRCPEGRQRLVRCSCDCGRKHRARLHNLRAGRVLSCGCVRRGVQIPAGGPKARKQYEAPAPRTVELGGYLRAARKRNGWSLEALAASAGGLSKGYLSDVERGIKCPSVAVLATLCRELEVDHTEACALGGLLPEAIAAYLVRQPRALHVLRLLAERDADDAVIDEALAGITRWRHVA